MAAHAPVHAHELRPGPGKIEAGVKILAEEIENARARLVNKTSGQITQPFRA